MTTDSSYKTPGGLIWGVFQAGHKLITSLKFDDGQCDTFVNCYP